MKKWKEVKLGEIISEKSIRNKHEKIKDVLSITNSVGFVLQKEYFEGVVHSNNIENYKIVEKYDFAYNPSRINVGSIDMLKTYDNGVLSPMYVVFEVNKALVLPEYLKYYFQTYSFCENVKANTQGSVRNSLNFKELSEFNYILPPIDEQKKIILILSKVDKIISNIDKQMIQVKKQKEDFMEKLFLQKGKRKRIGEFADVTKLAGFEFTKHIKYIENGEIIAIRALNIKEGQLDLTDVKRIERQVSEKLIRSKLYMNDILFSYVGTIGEVAIIEEEDKYHLAPNVAKITIKGKNIIAEYIYFYLRNKVAKTEIYKYTTLTSQPAMSMQNIRKVGVNILPVAKQKAIMMYNKEFDRKIRLINEKRKLFNQLKRGLMQQLLTGKIRVKI